MKRKIFDLLMEIKAEVLKSLKPPEAEIVSSEIQVSPGSEMPIVDDVVFATLEEDEPKAISFDGKTKSITPETRYFQIQDAEHSRKIAYTVSGDMDADNLLLCLPGLLETKASFLVIHAYFLKFDNCKVISIDFSGRGESDYVDEHGVHIPAQRDRPFQANDRSFQSERDRLFQIQRDCFCAFL